MKTLLIGSSFSAMPFLYALKSYGANVTVIGKYPNDPCHAYVDNSIYEDYSDREKLLDICRNGRFDYIVPSCNDYSYVAGSFVADALGLPGFDNPEVTAIIHTKDKFRQFCKSAGVPSPRIYGEITPSSDVSDLIAGFQGAVLIKPVDSFSGRGVELVRAADELEDAVARAMSMSRSKRAVAEQFVDGALHSHTAFIANGQVVWHEFVDEFCEVYRYQVDRSLFPSRLRPEMREAVHRSMEGLINKLGLCDGLLHTQFIANDDEFWIVESMRRCPGDFYGHHFRYAFGYDYEAQYVAGFVDHRPLAPTARAEAVAIERRVLSVSHPEAFFAIHMERGGPERIYIPLKDSGQKLESAPFDKAGILFMLGELGGAKETLSSAKAHMLFHA